MPDDNVASDKYRYIYSKKSVEQRVNRRKLATALLVFILIALLVAGSAYAIISLIDFNSFRISVDRNSVRVLSLSDDYDFTNPSASLSTRGPETIMDTTYNRLPIYTVLKKDGSIEDNSYNCIANSFYLVNVTDEDQRYREKIVITNAYKGLEHCIRVLVIKQPYTYDAANDAWIAPDASHMTYTCYAAAKEDGSDEQVAYLLDEQGEDTLPLYCLRHYYDEDGNQVGAVPYEVQGDDRYQTDPQDIWMCSSFLDFNSGVIADTEYYPISPRQKIRYSIVVWIEGTDAQTVNATMDGKVTMSVQFTTQQ